MKKDASIRILGRTSNEIGDQFEILTKHLLARLGFGSFIRNAYETGAEIDLRASHKVTNTPILCECKAHTKPIGAKSVKLFHSQVEKERKADSRLVGLMFSTSGFVGTAEAWYREMVEDDPNTAQYLQLNSGQTIIQMLVDREMTLEPTAIQEMVRQRLSTYEQDECWLTYSIHGLAWIILLLVDGKPRFHTIVNERGKPLPTWICREIAELSQLETRLLGLEVRRKVILTLLEQENQTTKAITENCEESLDDVSLALEKLITEGMIRKQTDEHLFARDVVPFVNLARELLAGKDALTFIRSTYTQEMLRSEVLLSYIDQRYNLEMNSHQKGILGRILSISPDAAQRALFGDTQRYRITHQQILEKVQDDQEKSRWMLEHTSSLSRELLPVLIGDLGRLDRSIAGHLADLSIKRYRWRVKLDMAGSSGLYLSVDSTAICAIETGTGPMKAGSLVSSTNPAAHLYWNGNLYLDTKEFELALQEFDKALRFCCEGSVEPKWHQAILVNKGVTFMRQEKWSEAVACFDEALALEDLFVPTLLDNKAICLNKMGMYQAAADLVLEAERRFPQLLDNEFHQQTKREICETDSFPPTD